MQTKKLNFSIFFFLLIFVAIKTATCQENYVSGMVITQKGDTLHGFIDYRNWGSNPDKIAFKGTENAAVVIFTPNTIRGFKVNNELYIGAVVQAEISTDQTNDLDFDNEIRLRIDTTFLQAMFVGTKSLYYYNDKFGKQNFYINQWPDFELLVYKKYLKPNKQKGGNDYNESTNIITENKKFVGQLLLYLQDCQGIKSKINTTAYHMKGMESLFKSYYDCSHSPTSYTYKKEKIKADFGALAGVSVTKLKLTTELAENFRPYSNVDYNPSYNFSGGIFMDIVMARNQRKWSIYSELLYSDYKATSHVEDRTNENNYNIYDITVGYTYLELNCMLRFTYPLINDLLIFGNAGLSLGHAISETNLLVTETKFYSTPVISEGSAIKETRLNEQGIIAGVGSRYKKYSFEMRLQRSNGMSVYTALSSKTNQLYVLLGYRF